MALLRFTQKFKMAGKNVGKAIFQKITSRLCRYPASQKFRQNCSISNGFPAKCVFAFYAEIQDGHQKFENSKWPPFLKRGIFFKIAKNSLLRYPVGRKFRRNRSILHG